VKLFNPFFAQREMDPGVGGLDTLSEEFFRDPYPFYRYLRTHDPLHWTKQGCLLITRRADVLQALKNPILGSAPADFATTHSRNRDLLVCADVASNLLPFLDGAAYVRTRQFLAPALRKSFEANPPDAAAAVARLLPPLLERGAFDVLNDFARPLALQIACEFMGLRSGRHDDLYRWTDNFFRLFSPLPAALEREQIDRRLIEFREYFREVLDERRRRPGEELMSMLAAKQIGGEGLSDQQIIDNCMLIFADAIENVDAAIASSLLALQRHPAEFRKLRNDPDLLPAAIEEALRYEAPGQTAPRVVREDAVIEGVFVRRNTVVLLGLGSANRDPEAFEDPDSFSLSRPKQDHLSFGRGNHSCIGFFLVRAEMKAALGGLLASTRKVKVHDKDLSWEARPGHRWLTSLNITVSRK